MANPSNHWQDASNVILDFKKPLIGSTELNFGEVGSGATIDCTVNLGMVAEIAATFKVNQIAADIGCGLIATISAQYAESGNINATIGTGFAANIAAQFTANLCTLDAVIACQYVPQTTAGFEINNQRGLSFGCKTGYQSALPSLDASILPWEKPQIKSLTSGFFYAQSEHAEHGVHVGFFKVVAIYRAIKTVFEQAGRLAKEFGTAWQENSRAHIERSTVWQIGQNNNINRGTTWQEMIRKRRELTYRFEVALPLQHRHTFEWAKGLKVVTRNVLPWQVAKPTYYRKHPVEPWVTPTPQPYRGDTVLNFICPLGQPDAHNIVLDFGVEDCIPVKTNIKGYWHIVNTLNVTRLDNGQQIDVISGDYRSDRSSWCWTYGLTVPASELAKLNPSNGKPVILQIAVNGFTHLMLLENRTRNRQFAKDTYKLTGRSVSALLDAPSSPTRAFLQENERTSRQLVQAEIDRSAYPDLELHWQLIDELGWIVPTESMSYSGLTPIAAIKQIADAAGGFIYSDGVGIVLKPRYKKTWWDKLQATDYDVLLPESIVLEQSTDYEQYPDYNAVTLTNDKTGLTGQVKRTATAGDVLLETVNNRLFSGAAVMGAYGKAALAKAGLVEMHSFSMPLNDEVGCKPADLIGFAGQRWGIVDSVSVSFSYAKITQSITVERVNHE